MNFRGAFRVIIDRNPYPEILHPDPIVRVTRSCICGSDLHLYHGLVPDTRIGSTFVIGAAAFLYGTIKRKKSLLG